MIEIMMPYKLFKELKNGIYYLLDNKLNFFYSLQLVANGRKSVIKSLQWYIGNK